MKNSVSVEMNPMSGEVRSKADIIGQIPVPWYKKEHKYSPWLLKCDGKIVKYEMRGLHVWKALVTVSHTILAEMDTWYHLIYLTVLCFSATGFCYATSMYKSVDMDVSVVNRIQFLVSFVFAGYIGIVINRWDRIRNVTLGTMWGATENLNVLLTSKLHPLKSDPNASKELIAKIDNLFDRLLRYSRLTFALTFMALQSKNDLEPLLRQGGPSRSMDTMSEMGVGAGGGALLTPKEREWLDAVSLGTRPLHTCMWMLRIFETLDKEPFKVKINESQDRLIYQNITGLRGGIGATIGTINAQLPYGYVHIVYWVIQVMLVWLAIETGINLATMLHTKQNGNGNYTPDSGTWPARPWAWFSNAFVMYTCSNMTFCLFCEGLLKLCDKLSNPCSEEDSSFSERVYDSFIYNNIKSMRSSYTSYDDLFRDEITSSSPHSCSENFEEEER